MAPDHLVRTLNLEEHDKSTKVPILDVPILDVFDKIIVYIYRKDIPLTEIEDAKAIIDAADKYGVDSIKCAAEMYYVNNFHITTENVADLLYYADAKNCLKLKEAAMKYLTLHTDEVVASDAFSSLCDSKHIMKEIVLSMST